MSRDVDHLLEHNIRVALEAAREVDGLAIIVWVHDGVPVLSGEVISSAERLRVVEIASIVTGVPTVRNELKVRPSRSAWRLSDAVIREGILRVIAELGLAREGLDVAVESHVVTLRGSVRSLAERAELRHAVSMVQGVDFVDDATQLQDDPVRERTSERASSAGG
jgi:osmotically-inducible protein OsmY